MITPIFYIPAVVVALCLTACDNLKTSVSFTLGDADGRTVGAEITLEKTEFHDPKNPEPDVTP